MNPSEARAEAAKIRAEYSAVTRGGSQPSGEWNWKLSRAERLVEWAESVETGKPLHFGGVGKAILLIGVSRLPAPIGLGGKSRSNSGLRDLDGQTGSIRMAASGQSWVVTLCERGERIHVLNGKWASLPSLNTTNGVAAEHYITLATASLALECLKSAQSGKKFAPSKIETLHAVLEADGRGMTFASAIIRACAGA